MIFVTPRFRRAFDALMELEGGYVNDPDDAGGETKYGISAKSYPGLDVANLTREDAEQIYLIDYWSRVRGEDFRSEPLALHVFLFAAHAGTRRSSRLLQVALNGLGRPLSADGIIGRATIEAANACDPAKLLDAFKAEVRRYYMELVSRKPSQAKYLDGWFKRLDVEVAA